MNKVLLITLLWLAVGFVTPFSFAQSSTESGEIYNPNKVLRSPKPYDWCNDRGCGYGNPNPTWPPERKCGACLEAHIIEIKTLKTPSPSPSGTDVKGIQTTPEPTAKKVSKPRVKPIVSPSPLSSPSASISASPSAQPILESAKQKQPSSIAKIWNWILNLFNS